MKKLLTIIMVLALALSLFAGCSSDETAETTDAAETEDSGTAADTEDAEAATDTEETAEAADTEETAEAADTGTAADVEEPTETTDAEEPTETTDTGEVAAVEETADTGTVVAQPAMLSYPLEGDDNSISYWYYIPPYSQYVNSNSDFYCISYAAQCTGVSIDFIEVSQSSATEQYQLMIASGDWPDINPANEYYTNGLLQAYEDEVILDLLAYDLDALMPNLMDIFNQQTDDTQAAALDEDKLLAFPTIADGTYSGNGLVTRGDWLDEQGISYEGQMMTLDEYTDLLYTLQENYGATYGYPCTDGTMPLKAAFNTAIPCLISDGFMTFPDITLCVYGDEVASGWTTDGYREYLEWLYTLIQDDVMEDVLETYSDASDRQVQNSYQANGEISTWQANADKLDECAELVTDTEDASFYAQALPVVVADEAAMDEEYLWNDIAEIISQSMSISSTSENAELCLQWQNYFYTDEGYLLYNYGIDTETAEALGYSLQRTDTSDETNVSPVWYGSYTIDENGDVQWTDMVTDTSYGGNAEMFSSIYTMNRFVGSYSDNDRLLSTFSDNALAAVELWTIDGSDSCNYPTAIDLTSEETEEVNKYLGDILSWGPECILKMLTGQTEINDETWAEYVDSMNQLGLQRIIDVYQIAYDEHAAGER